MKKSLNILALSVLMFCLEAKSCPIPLKPATHPSVMDWSKRKNRERLPSAAPLFGSANAAFWSSEAVFANVGEAFLNQVKGRPEVKDAWVSIPLKIQGSNYFPFGDGQSNSKIQLPRLKEPNNIPYLAALLYFKDPKRAPEVEIRFHPGVATTSFKASLLKFGVDLPAEEAYKNLKMNSANGTPTVLFSLGDLKPQMIQEIFTGQRGFWISGAGWADGFPILFKANAWRKIAAQEKSLFPSLEESFKGLKFFAGSTPNFDPQNLASATLKLPEPRRAIVAYSKAAWKHHQDAGPIGFIMKGTDFGRFQPFPAHPKAKSPPLSVHGEYKDNFETPTSVYSSVGGVLTRYALKGQMGSNVKHLYTCFTARTPELEIVKQPDPKLPPGVPSGAGWHKVGDPAETVINSLETAPVLTAVASENPLYALQKTKKFSFDLNSVATLRWTEPGEAFITAKGEHHWYAVHDTQWPVCTEILVHECVPTQTNALGMKCPQ